MTEQSAENDAAACPRCGGAWVPYWFTYGGEIDVCEDPVCNGWRPRTRFGVTPADPKPGEPS